jgi:hypothetical protein
MYSITDKIKSKKNEYQSISRETIKQWVKIHNVGYEVLLSNVIPYYDFDNKYATESEQKKAYHGDLNSSYTKVKKQYETAKIYSFCASGYDNITKEWKNSFHYRIRNAGYYTRGRDIHMVDGCDNAVYKKKNSRQLMRLPFTSKEGNNRPLLRVCVETYTKYNIDQIADIGECITDYLIQNISDETLSVSEKRLDKTEEKQVDILIKTDDLCGFNLSNIDDLCGILDTKRFDHRRKWLRFIRCIKNIGIDLGIDTEPIAHKYSKLSSKYNQSEVESFFQNHSDEKKLSLGSLCYWAKLDNPEKYIKMRAVFKKLASNKIIKMLNTASSEPIKYSFSDYTNFVNTELPDEYEILKFLSDTVIHIIDGGSHKIFTRNLQSDKSIKFNPVDSVFDGINDFEITISDIPQRMSMFFQQNFYHVKSYNFIDFIPYLSENPCGAETFNLFQGFQYKFQHCDLCSELDKMFYHIKTVICADDEVVYEYILNYITHLFQRPNEKIGVALLLQSTDHGTGKNRFTDFLSNIVGSVNIYKANKMEDVCASFNYHMQGKLLVIGDEIANYSSHKFADLLKALITEVDKAITPKGKDSYVIKSFERYIFTSNNDFSFRIESGDRRLLPLAISNKHKGDTVYFNELSEIIESPRLQEMFFNYMASRDIENWNYRNIPQTKMKTDLITEGLDPVIHFIIDLCNKQAPIEKNILTCELFATYKAWCVDNSYRPYSDRKLGKELKSLDIIKKKIMVNNSRKYNYIINKTNIEKKIQSMTNEPSFKFDEVDECEKINPIIANDDIYDSDDEEPDNDEPDNPIDQL